MKTYCYRYYLHDGSGVKVHTLDCEMSGHDEYVASLKERVSSGEFCSVTREYLYETDLDRICVIEPVEERVSCSVVSPAEEEQQNKSIEEGV